MTKQNKRMENFIKEVDSFLDNYKDGSELQLHLSSLEKDLLEEYIRIHPKGGKDFFFMNGVLKPGYLEHDFMLRKKN